MQKWKQVLENAHTRSDIIPNPLPEEGQMRMVRPLSTMEKMLDEAGFWEGWDRIHDLRPHGSLQEDDQYLADNKQLKTRLDTKEQMSKNDHRLATELEFKMIADVKRSNIMEKSKDDHAFTNNQESKIRFHINEDKMQENHAFTTVPKLKMMEVKLPPLPLRPNSYGRPPTVKTWKQLSICLNVGMIAQEVTPSKVLENDQTKSVVIQDMVSEYGQTRMVQPLSTMERLLNEAGFWQTWDRIQDQRPPGSPQEDDRTLALDNLQRQNTKEEKSKDDHSLATDHEFNMMANVKWSDTEEKLKDDYAFTSDQESKMMSYKKRFNIEDKKLEEDLPFATDLELKTNIEKEHPLVAPSLFARFQRRALEAEAALRDKEEENGRLREQLQHANRELEGEYTPLVPSLLVKIQKRALQAEKALKMKERENSILLEQLQNYEKRFSEHKAKIESKEQSWQTLFASLQKRALQAEEASKTKERENLILIEQFQNYEKRCSDHEAKMNSMEQSWQTLFASLQLKLEAGKNKRNTDEISVRSRKCDGSSDNICSYSDIITADDPPTLPGSSSYRSSGYFFSDSDSRTPERSAIEPQTTDNTLNQQRQSYDVRTPKKVVKSEPKERKKWWKPNCFSCIPRKWRFSGTSYNRFSGTSSALPHKGSSYPFLGMGLCDGPLPSCLVNILSILTGVQRASRKKCKISKAVIIMIISAVISVASAIILCCRRLRWGLENSRAGDGDRAEWHLPAPPPLPEMDVAPQHGKNVAEDVRNTISQPPSPEMDVAPQHGKNVAEDVRNRVSRPQQNNAPYGDEELGENEKMVERHRARAVRREIRVFNSDAYIPVLGKGLVMAWKILGNSIFPQ